MRYLHYNFISCDRLQRLWFGGEDPKKVWCGMVGHSAVVEDRCCFRSVKVLKYRALGLHEAALGCTVIFNDRTV